MSIDKQRIAKTTSEILIEVGAINFDASKPFITTSGWASPVYIDCRRLISFPRARKAFVDMVEEVVLSDIGYEVLDGIAGGETAGIPFAAWVADRLTLPMQYVRKRPKGFGKNAQIEGHFSDGQNILLMEDLTTDGKSKLNFVGALRRAGATVEHCFVLFHYDIFKESRLCMAEAGVTLHSLATWWDVLGIARARSYFDASTLREVEKFLNAPAAWSAAHGGAVGAEA
jgi:orotate phosphoribosyltransferase